MRRVSNHRFAGRSEPEQGSRRFSCCSNGGDPVVTDRPGKPEQTTPAKTVTDTGIAPYIFFEGAPNFGFANGVVNVTLAAVAKVAGARQPVLYVEFRKDGIPVDPSPMVGRKRKPEGSRMMMRKTSLILLGAAAGVTVTLIATPPRIVLDGARAQAAAADTYRQLSLFGDVFERVRADYVEKPDDSKLIESAINGMLAGLDPHSSYMDSKNFRDMQVQTRGEFGGLGIEVTMEDGLIKVVAPIDETPAAKAGIMANDIITHLDEEPVQGLTLNQAVEKMRGPENSKIKLKIMRKRQDKPIEVSITRARIQVRSVRSRLEGDDVGFIRVTQFNEQTAEGLKKAITDLSTQAGDKLKGYVIDLRNNPGGLLDQAIS